MREDLAPFPGQPIVATTALAGSLHPTPFEPAPLLQAIKQGIQSGRAEAQFATGSGFDQLANLVAVALPGLDQGQDEELGAALLQLAVGRHISHSDILTSDNKTSIPCSGFTAPAIYAFPVFRPLLLASVLCAIAVPLPAAQNKTLRVLFIGNSLTYANELPAMVREIARAAGGVRIDVASVAKPDFGLAEHWLDGEASKVIARGRWDVVVLQQGPSSQPDSRVILRDYVKRYDEQIRKVGARTALYSVWPSRARSKDFDGVSESYEIAAKDVGALLMPAGEAWRAAWRRDPALPLYDRDGFHPSQLGSCLAALVVFKAIAQSVSGAGRIDDRGFPPCVPRDTQNAADVRTLLRMAAAEAVKEQP